MNSRKRPRSPSPTPMLIDEAGGDKEDEDAVKVFVRCRPLNLEEKKWDTQEVITCNENRREVVILNSATKEIHQILRFDKVFGPETLQKDFYEQALSTNVSEVLKGYSCTIIAYGQTGTGKTYTMEGGERKMFGEFPSDAGVIPRAVKQIFDTLEAQNANYKMKVTFWELYNEEITDLLGNDATKEALAFVEDGKGGVCISGLREEEVHAASGIFKILEIGKAKRRRAERLLKKQSSCLHSTFSITIHIKECTPEGEEMIKCGKLNMVDLAGSENISQSGAREGRAREDDEINKSLLTLDQVINALVKQSDHIPYGDSKLTRFLSDSLGGKTKTCIIATVTPSGFCLQETFRTLDFAERAKNIKNKPEINQKLMRDVIKDRYCRIEKLKQGLPVPILFIVDKNRLTSGFGSLDENENFEEGGLILLDRKYQLIDSAGYGYMVCRNGTDNLCLVNPISEKIIGLPPLIEMPKPLSLLNFLLSGSPDGSNPDCCLFVLRRGGWCAFCNIFKEYRFIEKQVLFVDDKLNGYREVTCVGLHQGRIYGLLNGAEDPHSFDYIRSFNHTLVSIEIEGDSVRLKVLYNIVFPAPFNHPYQPHYIDRDYLISFGDDFFFVKKTNFGSSGDPPFRGEPRVQLMHLNIAERSYMVQRKIGEHRCIFLNMYQGMIYSLELEHKKQGIIGNSAYCIQPHNAQYHIDHDSRLTICHPRYSDDDDGYDLDSQCWPDTQMRWVL